MKIVILFSPGLPGTKHAAYIDDSGVYRWTSNDRVPPEDILVFNQLPKETLALCRAAREKELDVFLTEYRAARAARGYSAEEKAEMRAAFGPGAKVVDVITGKRIKL